MTESLPLWKNRQIHPEISCPGVLQANKTTSVLQIQTSVRDLPVAKCSLVDIPFHGITKSICLAWASSSDTIVSIC